MRQAAFIVLVTVVLALGATTGWYWWTAWRFQQTTDDAYVQSDITVISPKVEGYIKEVRIADNQEVTEGSVLFVIDDRDFAPKWRRRKQPLPLKKQSSRPTRTGSNCSKR